MDDVRVYVDLPDHPKTRALAERLDVPLAHAMGLVVALWTHARKVAPSGELPGATAEDLARWCRWTGDPEQLALALVASSPGHRRGFLQSLPVGGFRIVGWAERQPLATRTHALDRLNARPADARGQAARVAGLASQAARRARGLGLVRDAATGRLRSPNAAPHVAPNGSHRTSPDAEPTQVLSRPNDSPDGPARSSPNHENPPPPLPDADRSFSRSPDPNRIGPRPPPSGSALDRIHADLRDGLARVLAKDPATLTVRDCDFARHAHGRLRAIGHDLPDLVLPETPLPDPAPAFLARRGAAPKAAPAKPEAPASDRTPTAAGHRAGCTCELCWRESLAPARPPAADDLGGLPLPEAP